MTQGLARVASTALPTTTDREYILRKSLQSSKARYRANGDRGVLITGQRRVQKSSCRPLLELILQPVGFVF